MHSVQLTALYRAAQAPQVPLVGPGLSLPRRIPIMKQDMGPTYSHGTCGPTCVEAVRQYWTPARQVNLNEWQTVQQTAVNAALRGVWLPSAPSMGWCNPEALADTLRQDGLNARVELDVTPAAIATWIANGDTIIAHGVLDGVSLSMGHYRVIEGVDATGVHLMDPDTGSLANPTVDWATFMGQVRNVHCPRGQAIRANRAPLK